MSYILEALRKADAERERGAVPGLHAQLIPLTAGRAGDEPAHMPIGWWVGIGGAVLALGLLVWWWFAAVGGAGVAPAPTAMPASAAVAPSTARSVEPAAPAPSTPSAAASAAAAVVASATAMPSPARAAAPKALPKPKPKPRPAAPPRAAPKTAAKAPVQAPAAASPVAPAATIAQPTAAPAEARVPPLAELPEDVRRQLPAMAMGGSVYSTEPARRMVIVNGQVFVEGSTLAPELKLEKINPKSAVFSIRGQRFQLPL